MKVHFLMQIHDNTPSGGRKIIYSYANYLIEQGHQVKITFVADAPYRQRRLNMLAMFKHIMIYTRVKNKQDTITWYPLSDKIKICTNRLLEDAFKEADKEERIVFTNFSFPLSYQEHVGVLTNNMYYLIQHDESVYASEKNVRNAWRLDIKKIVISSWLKNAVKEYSNKVYLVKNYTETKKFYLTVPFSDRKNVVSMIYHPLTAKGTEDGLRAMALVKKAMPDVKMILFGTPDRPKQLPDDYIYYKCASSDLLRESVYNQSRVFIMPSLKEGWGLVATEAMACGAALVSTYNGGVDDFAIHEKTALLSNPGDYNSLAENTKKLLQTPALNEEIADAGRIEVNELTFLTSAKNFEYTIQR